MKRKIKAFLPLTIFLAFMYLYGLAGSLEVDKLTVNQFVVRVSITLLYMVIAAVTYKIIEGKEDEWYGKEDR